jgi:hypothetical protein
LTPTHPHSHTAHARIVPRVLSNAWLREQGVPDLKAQWIELHYGKRTPNRDPASVNLAA